MYYSYRKLLDVYNFELKKGIEDLFTLDLFFLQEAAHHLLPEPSITPFPWNTTPLSFENSSHILWNFGSQLLGSSGATIFPSICKKKGF